MTVPTREGLVMSPVKRAATRPFASMITVVGIAVGETLGNRFGVVGHESGEEDRGPRSCQRKCVCAHTTLYTSEKGKRRRVLSVESMEDEGLTG